MTSQSLRLAALSSLLALGACADDPAEPLSLTESAASRAAVEGMVVAISPLAGVTLDVGAIAASFQASFGLGGLSCATVAMNDATSLTVTFDCAGLLSTNGSLELELTSPTTLAANAALTIGGIDIAAALTIDVPSDPNAERSFDGDLSIATPNRTLEADASASWTRAGGCVTYSADASVEAHGPNGDAEGTIEVTDHTVCH